MADPPTVPIFSDRLNEVLTRVYKGEAPHAGRFRRSCVTTLTSAPTNRPPCQRAVAAHPNDANALDTLGWTQYLRDDMDAALGALLRAIQIDPERAAVHYHAGRVYQKRGERDGARREYLEASRLGERSGDTESAEAAKTALRELGGQS